MWQTIAVAFSMFSHIPMPRVDWSARNLRYSMCAFPLVGVVIGAICILWGYFWMHLSPAGGLLPAAGFVLLPLAVTGGIHWDGFCDTADALASHAPRSKKLAILKDPHTGAFAVLALVGCLLLQFAACTALPLAVPVLFQLGLGFVWSRCLSGLAVASFPCAKDSGLLHTFACAADKRRVRAVLLALALVCNGAVLLVEWRRALLLTGCAWGTFAYYRHMSRTKFGGITGDLAGWFLQVCETVLLTALAAGCLLFGKGGAPWF